MNFIEEKTPAGYIIKILRNSEQFVVFDENGNSISAYGNSDEHIHKILFIVFLGRSFRIKQAYTADYTLLKVRDEQLIVPYSEWMDRKTKYMLLPTDVLIDVIPAKIILITDIFNMMRNIEFNVIPDYVLVDSSVKASDEDIIKGRFHANKIIHIDAFKTANSKKDGKVSDNINMLSSNSIFLAMEHLRTGNMSKLRQLVLELDLTAKELEYILAYTNRRIDELHKINPNNHNMLKLKNMQTVLFFYMDVLNNNEEDAKTCIDNTNDETLLIAFRTLIVKLQASFSDNDRIDFEDFLIECDRHIQKKSAAVKKGIFTQVNPKHEQEAELSPEDLQMLAVEGAGESSASEELSSDDLEMVSVEGAGETSPSEELSSEDLQMVSVESTGETSPSEGLSSDDLQMVAAEGTGETAQALDITEALEVFDA